MRLSRVLLLALLVAILGVACSDDDPVTPDPPCTDCERNDVLLRVEEAYNQRRIELYRDTLDAQFTFFFHMADVGGEIPEFWDRQTDIAANTRLFDMNDPELPCQVIEMDIRQEDGVSWDAITDPPIDPGKTWYKTTLYYEFRFEIAPDTYLSGPGSRAEFTVRNVGTVDAPHWRLVEMRDLGALELSASSASTYSTTWGKVKSLYR